MPNICLGTLGLNPSNSRKPAHKPGQSPPPKANYEGEKSFQVSSIPTSPPGEQFGSHPNIIIIRTSSILPNFTTMMGTDTVRAVKKSGPANERERRDAAIMGVHAPQIPRFCPFSFLLTDLQTDKQQFHCEQEKCRKTLLQTGRTSISTLLRQKTPETFSFDKPRLLATDAGYRACCSLISIRGTSGSQTKEDRDQSWLWIVCSTILSRSLCPFGESL